MPAHVCTYSENLVKIGPVLSEIGLQGTVKKEVTSLHLTFRHAYTWLAK